MGISVNGSIQKMRGLAIIFLSVAAVVRANPCQNDEDVYFPDPEDCGRFYMCVDDSMGNLRGGCIQLLRKGATSPGNLDTYYWARAATNTKCTSNDGDNGVICEM